VFPGFNWSNLRESRIKAGFPPINDTSVDRIEGRLLWEQYRLLADAGCTMVYQAMFDEIDEGTQIFKVTANPPPGQNRLFYPPPLPTDYYLRLVGLAATHFRLPPHGDLSTSDSGVPRSARGQRPAARDRRRDLPGRRSHARRDEGLCVLFLAARRVGIQRGSGGL
jgi:hypothetical protein